MQKRRPSILETHPTIAQEWDFEKNNGIDISHITSTAKIRVFWLCKNGHSFQAFVNNRCKKDRCRHCPNPKRHRYHIVNETYFDKWSNNMAYILGFIYTDGSINNYTLSIELQERDIEILNFIKAEICPSANISYKRLRQKDGVLKNYVRIRINSIILIRSLNKLGVFPKKSLVVQLGCKIPEQYVGHFLRGAFDGDGWVYCRRNGIESGIVSASKCFLNDVQELCGGIGRQHIKMKKTKNGKVSITYTLNMYTSETMLLRDMLYKTQDFGLKRKKEVFFSDFYTRSNHYWTDEQLCLLIDNYVKGGDLNKLSLDIGKTYKAVSKKIWELQLTSKESK